MLELYELYTRSDAQQIFEPDYKFEPSRGTWGLHGVIRLPNKKMIGFSSSHMDNRNRDTILTKVSHLKEY